MTPKDLEIEVEGNFKNPVADSDCVLVDEPLETMVHSELRDFLDYLDSEEQVERRFSGKLPEKTGVSFLADFLFGLFDSGWKVVVAESVKKLLNK